MLVAFLMLVTVLAIAAAMTGNPGSDSGATLITAGSVPLQLAGRLVTARPARSRGASGWAFRSCWLAGCWAAVGVLVYTDVGGLHCGRRAADPGSGSDHRQLRGDSLIPGLGGNRPVMAERNHPSWSAGGATVKRGVQRCQ